MYSCLHVIPKHSQQKEMFHSAPVLLRSWACCCHEGFLPLQSWLSCSQVPNTLAELCAHHSLATVVHFSKQTASRPPPGPSSDHVCAARMPRYTAGVAVTTASPLSLTAGVSCLPGDGSCLLPPRIADHPGLCVPFLSNFTTAEGSP